MKPGAGKVKGSSFERKVCTLLSLWVTKDQLKDVFWRSAMSGGRATVAKGLVRQAGDIAAVAPEGHALTDYWYIECKALKSIDLIGTLTGKGKLAKIWKHVWGESHKYGKLPILVIKQNHFPILFCTSAVGVQRLQLSPVASSGLLGCSISLFEDVLATPFARRVNTRPDKTSPWLVIDKVLQSYYAGRLPKKECCPWPTHTSQVIKVGERQVVVSRLVCLMVHGIPQNLELEAAHECGNGHVGCINPHHLRWKTSKENHADVWKHRWHGRGPVPKKEVKHGKEGSKETNKGRTQG